MARIKNIEEIESIMVHWSESNLINDVLGCDDGCDIEKLVKPDEMDQLTRRAGKSVGCGYDKTSMTVKLKNGLVWANECKFYISSGDNSLLNVLNKGEQI